MERGGGGNASGGKCRLQMSLCMLSITVRDHQDVRPEEMPVGWMQRLGTFWLWALLMINGIPLVYSLSAWDSLSILGAPVDFDSSTNRWQCHTRSCGGVARHSFSHSCFCLFAYLFWDRVSFNPGWAYTHCEAELALNPCSSSIGDMGHHA